MAKANLLDALDLIGEIAMKLREGREGPEESERDKTIASLKGRVVQGSSYKITDDRRHYLELTYGKDGLKFDTFGYPKIHNREDLDDLISYLLGVRDNMK